MPEMAWVWLGVLIVFAIVMLVGAYFDRNNK